MKTQPAPSPAPADARLAPTQDIHVRGITALATPRALKADLPLAREAHDTVVEGRETIKSILTGDDRRLLVIVGPCSIHDDKAAREYAGRLHTLARQLADKLVIVMRVYFEKPRTTIGWKGLINDPQLDGSFKIEVGLRQARKLLLDINRLGLPAATEVLDPIVPQYIADLVAWAAIGARTTESQTHRQMASGLSMPIGFKNSTSGDFQIAMDAMRSARHPHSFLGIDEDGKTAVIHTTGNPWGHLILRGGGGKPNYDRQTVADAARRLAEAMLPTGIMVDCSHANSGKKCEAQEVPFRHVVEQRAGGQDGVIGVMLESNLHAGNQPLTDDGKGLRYGVSITDECTGWEKTEELLRWAHDKLS